MSCVAMRRDWWDEVEGLDQTKEIVQHMTEGLMADCSSSSVTTATDMHCSAALCATHVF